MPPEFERQLVEQQCGDAGTVLVEEVDAAERALLWMPVGKRLRLRAHELAAQLMENSPSSMRATKRLINGFIAGQLDQQISQAVQDNARIRTTADFREGIASFLEKRKPRWSGK